MPRPKKVVVKDAPVEVTEPVEAQEEVAEAVEILVQEIPETFKYNVTLEFNDQVHEFRTNDIAQSVYDLKPINLKTRVLFKATSEEGECERMLLLQLAKMMWRSKLGCEIFAMRLIFK